MNETKQSIINALKVNLGYQTGERIGIVCQLYSDNMGEDMKPRFEESERLCYLMKDTFQENNLNVTLLSYSPIEARNGADATEELYNITKEIDILFMPVAFSLTHTPYRKAQTAKGIRIASMPGFTIDMFAPDGPMGVDYNELDRKTREVADQLLKSNYVKVTAKDTEMVIEVDAPTTHVSSGILREKGAYGNLPGAESYVVPVHCGDSNGYFTVPAGWGGTKPLKYTAKFIVEQGRFVDILGETQKAQDYIDSHVKPNVLGQENYNIFAELGIGTNPNLTADYIAKKGWSTLTAEKIYGSAHFANGNSFGMGGQNNVPVHIDWVVPDAEITYNYKK